MLLHRFLPSRANLTFDVIMSVLYIACKKSVSGRKHAVTCDVCERWQHRLCDTGNIFKTIYRFILSFQICGRIHIIIKTRKYI